jgi:hypothetical protein
MLYVIPSWTLQRIDNLFYFSECDESPLATILNDVNSSESNESLKRMLRSMEEPPSDEFVQLDKDERELRILYARLLVVLVQMQGGYRSSVVPLSISQETRARCCSVLCSV